MAYDFLGAYKGDFMKSSLHVYTDLSGAMQYVGKTQNAKTLSRAFENIEWYDNTDSVQALYVLDLDKVDYSISFSFMQVAAPDVLQLAFNGEKDTSDPNRDFVFLGSNPGGYTEAQWRLVGQTRDERTMEFIIRSGICIPNGDITWGEPGSYSEVPVTIRALVDDDISTTTRDIGYFIIDKRTYS